METQAHPHTKATTQLLDNACFYVAVVLPKSLGDANEATPISTWMEQANHVQDATQQHIAKQAIAIAGTETGTVSISNYIDALQEIGRTLPNFSIEDTRCLQVPVIATQLHTSKAPAR